MAVQSQIGNMLDSITCTTVPCDIHQWYNDILSSVEHVVNDLKVLIKSLTVSVVRIILKATTTNKKLGKKMKL